jgi:hypothetical protein
LTNSPEPYKNPLAKYGRALPPQNTLTIELEEY